MRTFHLKLGRSKLQGFTLTESLISLALVAGLAVIAVVVFSSGSLLRRSDSARTELLTQARIIEHKFRDNLAMAIRPLGSTKGSFTGIKVLQDFGAPSTVKGIAVMTEHYGSLATPVLVVPNGQNGPEIHLKVEESDPLANYIFKSLTSSANKFYLISNMNTSNVVKTMGPPEEIDTNPPRFKVPIDSTNFVAGEYQGGVPSTIRTIQIVAFKFEDGKLIQTTHGDLPGAQGLLPQEFSRQVLAENMVDMEMTFSFEARGSSDIKLPGRRLSHPSVYLEAEGCQPSAENICCSDEELTEGKCVTFNHVKDIVIEFTLVKDVKGLKAQAPAGDGFVQLDDLIQLTHRSTYIPSRFGFSGFSTGMSATEYKCPIRDFASRCNAECAGPDGPFNNHNLNADGTYPADWHEYGNLESNYCKSGTINGVFIAPEQNTARIPSWDPNGSSDQPILYAAKHFPSCASAGGESWIMNKYPAAKLACWCLQPGPSGSWYLPSSTFYSRNLAEGSTYGEFVLNIPRDLSAANHILGSLNADAPNEHNMKCYIWRDCDTAAQNYFTGLTNTDAWHERCSCLSYQKDANGNTTNYKTHRIQADFNRLCNTDFRQGLSAQPACSTTIDTTSRKYYMKSATDPQGLDEEDIRFCECYNSVGLNSTNQTYGNSDSIDFRTGIPLQDPLLVTGYVPNFAATGTGHIRFGARQSLSVTTSALSRNGALTSEVTVAGNCDSSYCNVRHHAGIDLGCCTANRNIQWVPNNTVLQQRPELASVLNGAHGNYLDWVSYCSPECRGGQTLRVAGQNVDELTRVREIITGTARGGTIPPACGQWSSGSGLGQ